jgi:lysozyme
LKKYLKLKREIKKNEGFRDVAYKDSLGFATIGYGHLIKSDEKYFFQKKKIPKKYFLKLFIKDFDKSLKDYEKFYRKKKYKLNIKRVLIEMIFQLGIEKQRKFIKMNGYLEKKQPFMASLEMKNSLWYKQTPKRVDGLIASLLRWNHDKR